MAYKDKDKQREAIKAATRRYRAKKGDSALPSSKAVSQNARGLPVVDEVSDTQPVIPKCDTHVDVSTISAVKTLHALCDKAEAMVSKSCKRGKDSDFTKLLVQTGADVCLKASKPKPQSHSPMMVGYVPPKR